VHAFLCVAVFLLCMFIIHPVVEMGINDDWSYIRTAQVLAQTGHVVYNGWATAMLGWQLYLGALFIKVFGFSFTIARASTLLVSLPGTFLLHRVLARFGLSPWNATFGTLLLVLSPIFLPIAFTFMSDVTGFFCIVLCFYACQRALQSASARHAIAWLCFAGLSNIAGGTVRQIAWLGVLIVVPCTAWMLRRRKGALLVGVALWIVGLVSIYGCVHWFLQQPYSIPEESVARAIDRQNAIRLVHSLTDLFLSLLLFTCPVLIAFVPRVFDLPRSKLRIAVSAVVFVMVAASLFAAIALERGRGIDMMLLPWLGNIVTPNGILRYRNILGAEPITLGLWVRMVLTLVVLLSTLNCAAYLLLHRGGVRKKTDSQGDSRWGLSWRQTAGLLSPFAIGYVGLLLPRATFRLVVDRYLPPLVFVAAVFALRYLQERTTSRRHARIAVLLSTVCLMSMTFYGVAGAHDVFSLGRARLAATEEVMRSGVPRTSISGGMEYDGWTQIVTWGYIDEPHLKNPAGAYRPQLVSADPCQYWFEFLTPAVEPKFILAYEPRSCYAPSSFAPVAYSTWLPPYSEKVYIQRVP
jgi:hypothetical protein